MEKAATDVCWGYFASAQLCKAPSSFLSYSFQPPFILSPFLPPYISIKAWETQVRSVAKMVAASPFRKPGGKLSLDSHS